MEMMKMPQSTNVTLKERGNRYGTFESQGKISQSFKETMRDTDNWDKLTCSQKESLEMVVHKIARILNGDPNYADSWHDIAGYATLIDQELTGE